MKDTVSANSDSPRPRRNRMTVADVKSIVGSLSHSQGFYGRLWRDMDESNGWADLARAATKAGCTDSVSFVMWIEG